MEQTKAAHIFLKNVEQCTCGWRSKPSLCDHWEIQWKRHLDAVLPDRNKDHWAQEPITNEELFILRRMIAEYPGKIECW